MPAEAEVISTGLHTQANVLRAITAEGLRNRRGRLFNAQGFQRILRNPVSAGWICSPLNAGPPREGKTSAHHFPRIV
jgi:hypothetical protein